MWSLVYHRSYDYMAVDDILVTTVINKLLTGYFFLSGFKKRSFEK